MRSDVQALKGELVELKDWKATFVQLLDERFAQLKIHQIVNPLPASPFIRTGLIVQPAQTRQFLESPSLDAPPTRSLTSLSSTPSSPLPADQVPAPSSVAGQASSVTGSSPQVDLSRRSSSRKLSADWEARGVTGTPRGDRGRVEMGGLLASGKRARENDDSPAAVQPAASTSKSKNVTSTHEPRGGATETSEEGRERKRTKMFEPDVRSSDEEDSFDQSVIIGTKDGRSRDSVIQTKTGEEMNASMSTSNPSFFVSSSPTIDSTNHGPTPNESARKSLPITSLPFPLVSPFRGKSKTSPNSNLARSTAATAIFGDSSNLAQSVPVARTTFSFSQPLPVHPPRSIARLPTSSSVPAPPVIPQATPLALKTMYGTEKSATRFGDEVVDSPSGATTPLGYNAFGGVRRSTPSKPRFGGWGGFGGN